VVPWPSFKELSGLKGWRRLKALPIWLGIVRSNILLRYHSQNKRTLEHKTFFVGIGIFYKEEVLSIFIGETKEY